MTRFDKSRNDLNFDRYQKLIRQIHVPFLRSKYSKYSSEYLRAFCVHYHKYEVALACTAISGFTITIAIIISTVTVISNLCCEAKTWA